MNEKSENKKRLKADILLIAALLLIGAALLVVQLLHRSEGGEAVVYVNGERRAAYPLSEEREVRLVSDDGTSYNILVIRDGCADVTEAGCPDKICVHMHTIRYEGETIICLPNRTEIRIEGGEPSGVDVP